MISLAKRVIWQISGDKRTVGLLVFAPLLILTLLYLLLGDTEYKPTIAVLDGNSAIISALEKQNSKIITVLDIDVEQYIIDNRSVDAVLSISPESPSITMYESSVKSSEALKEIQEAMASLSPSSQPDIRFVHGSSEQSMFESMGYVFFGIISFFLIFIVSGMALVRERSAGTLERMMMSPISRLKVVVGYTSGYGLFAAIQSVVLVVFSIFILGLHSVGSIGWVILVMILLAIAAVLFGELISIYANTEFQVVQLIPIAIIPQVFFSGLIPIDTIPYGLGKLCYIMPVYYGCAAIKEIMVIGNGFKAILPYLLALIAVIFVLGLLNTMALKKYRKL